MRIIPLILMLLLHDATALQAQTTTLVVPPASGLPAGDLPAGGVVIPPRTATPPRPYASMAMSTRVLPPAQPLREAGSVSTGNILLQLVPMAVLGAVLAATLPGGQGNGTSGVVRTR